MKIGILSLILHTNYGGILQSYALQTILERMGHEVVVLNRSRDLHRSLYKEALIYVKCLIKRHLLRRNISYKTASQQNKERQDMEVNTNAFISKYIHTRMVAGFTADTFSDIEAVVVGSDQVWRPRYFKRQWKSGIENAFLAFLGAKSKKRIAYAASFGTDEWEYTEQETNKCAELLKKFDFVSVREDTGIRLCKDKLSRANAQHVLDPTMLLSKEDYIQLVKNANTPKSKGNLLCYILDDTAEKQQLVEQLANKQSLTPFHTKVPKGCVVPPLEQWIRGFMDAELVVTDSFHACVFSILFHKPFVVIGNKKRGYSRFESLLKLFGLENRLIENVTQFEPSMLEPLSDDVYKKLDMRKKQSMEFLNNALTD